MLLYSVVVGGFPDMFGSRFDLSDSDMTACTIDSSLEVFIVARQIKEILTKARLILSCSILLAFTLVFPSSSFG